MRFLVPALAVGLLLGACGSDGGDVPALWGRTFVATAVTDGGVPVGLFTGTALKLRFDRGAVRADAGCNSVGGDASVDGGRLRVTDVETTTMGCDPERHSRDAWVAELLQAGPELSLGGDELVLRSGRIEVRLVDEKVLVPDRALRGTRWTVETVIDGDVARSVPAGATAHVTFQPDGSMAGFDGCNDFAGKATDLGPDRLMVTLIGHDMPVACAPAAEGFDAEVRSVLSGPVGVAIDGTLLTLAGPGGRRLLLRA